jgi:hypothetical protein
MVLGCVGGSLPTETWVVTKTEAPPSMRAPPAASKASTSKVQMSPTAVCDAGRVAGKVEPVRNARSPFFQDQKYPISEPSGSTASASSEPTMSSAGVGFAGATEMTGSLGGRLTVRSMLMVRSPSS